MTGTSGLNEWTYFDHLTASGPTLIHRKSTASPLPHAAKSTASPLPGTSGQVSPLPPPSIGGGMDTYDPLHHGSLIAEVDVHHDPKDSEKEDVPGAQPETPGHVTDSMPNGTKTVTPTVCVVDGCDRPVKARGLCSRDYMRLRRTGNPDKVRRSGWPKDIYRKFWLETMRDAEWSERTFARFYWAVCVVKELAGRDGLERGFAYATRPNESFNVSALEEYAWVVVASDWARHGAALEELR